MGAVIVIRQDDKEIEIVPPYFGTIELKIKDGFVVNKQTITNEKIK